MHPLLILALAILGQANGPVKPDQLPLVLHRSMEIDDLDREILRQQDSVTLKRSRIIASQKLAQRGLVSPGDLERETADLRYDEAKEAESIAFRVLKTYERDVALATIPADEQKAFSLLLVWVRKQMAIAQVDQDYRASALKQTRTLFTKQAVSKQELDEAEISFNTAEATIALTRSREAQVLMEMARGSRTKPGDRAEVARLKEVYLSSRAHYFEVSMEGAKRRLELARVRSKLGLIPLEDLGFFERAAADAEAQLARERKLLPPPAPEPRSDVPGPGSTRDGLRTVPGSANVKP